MEKDVTRSIEEQLSAFLDGELPEAELQLLVRRLERDDALRATLARYAAIGSVLRQEPIHVSGDDLRQRLRVTIETEQSPEPVAADIPDQPAKSGRRALLAAGVAALAVIGLYAGNFPGGDIVDIDSVDPAQLSVATAPTETRKPVTLSVASGPEPAQASIDPDRMTSYLVSHGEYSRSFQGTMVDSRIFVQQASFER